MFQPACLLNFYSDTGPERVGFISQDDFLVEVPNISAHPENSFDVSGEDLIEFGEHAQASWHTHPGASANLSNDDVQAFKNHPTLVHHIVGNDGVRSFVVKNGLVHNA
jgi:proteasome lid subunit RPN8/RPN11